MRKELKNVFERETDRQADRLRQVIKHTETDIEMEAGRKKSGGR